MNHEGMEGSVIVITGGGSGMGAAMAKDFAERGAGIAILDLDEARGSAVADSITDANGKAVYKKVDVTDKQAVLTAADEVEQELGAIEKMLKHGGGTILNMSSLSGKKASAWQTVYCASKFGVQGLTQSIAKEFADRNIRVNSICPGIVYTEMWEKLKYEYAQKKGIDPEEVMPYFKKNIPIHRLVDLQDVINAAVFLLTDNSAYLTGQSINLTGGEWMD